MVERVAIRPRHSVSAAIAEVMEIELKIIQPAFANHAPVLLTRREHVAYEEQIELALFSELAPLFGNNPSRRWHAHPPLGCRQLAM